MRGRRFGHERLETGWPPPLGNLILQSHQTARLPLSRGHRRQRARSSTAPNGTSLRARVAQERPSCGRGQKTGDPETTAQRRHRSAPPLRAQKLPRATPRSMSISSAWSPTIRFNQASSFFKRLQPHHVFGPHRPEMRPPALVGLHRDLQVAADRVDVSTLRLQPTRLTELAHDLLRRVPLPLLHNGRTNFRGPVTPIGWESGAGRSSWLSPSWPS